MQDELQKLNINMAGVEDTGIQIKIRDQGRRTYSFFKNKKDGGETVAFQDFKKFKMGDTVEITYREVPYKDGSIRNIVAIRPATGAVQPAAPPPARSGRGGGGGDRPTREYWEAREATRQNSILLQVAFKSAIALEASRIRAGKEENKDRVYNDTLEFYDLMSNQLGDGESAPDLPEDMVPLEEPGF